MRMNRIQQLLTDAAAAFGRLTARERGLVSMSAGAVVVLIVALTSLSVSSAVSRREARIRTKAAQLDEVAKLTTGYRAAEMQRQDLERRLAGNKLQLFSYLDDLAKRQKIEIGGLSDKGSTPIPDTKVVEASVEVTFTRIPIEKILKFLQEVESGQGLVKVTRLQLRPRSDEAVLDAWLVLTTYTLSAS
jgi:type II secretory pathway component PulM